MPRIILCPGCQASLPLPNDYRGSACQCGRCHTVIPLTTAIQEVDRDVPTPVHSVPLLPPPLPPQRRPGQPSTRREAVPVGLILAGVGTGVVLLTGLLVGGIYLATRPIPPPPNQGPLVAEQPRGNPFPLEPFPPQQPPAVQPSVQPAPPNPFPSNNEGGVRPEYERPDPPAEQPFDVDPQLLRGQGKVYLNDLQEFAPGTSPLGWRFGKHGITGNGYEANQTIRVQGVHYLKGLSMHPPHSGYMRICYAVGQRASMLRGQVGMRDEHTPPTRFLVLGDGQLLWRSPTLTSDQRIPFAVAISSVKLLELRTYVENGNATYSNALWLDPLVELK